MVAAAVVFEWYRDAIEAHPQQVKCDKQVERPAPDDCGDGCHRPRGKITGDKYEPVAGEKLGEVIVPDVRVKLAAWLRTGPRRRAF